MGHSHNKCRRNTFAANIADTEEELLIANQEIEEVAPHFLGWLQYSIDIEVLAFRERWIVLREHFRLDVFCDEQFAIQSLFLHRSLMETLEVVGGPVEDIAQ